MTEAADSQDSFTLPVAAPNECDEEARRQAAQCETKDEVCPCPAVAAQVCAAENLARVYILYILYMPKHLPNLSPRTHPNRIFW